MSRLKAELKVKYPAAMVMKPRKLVCSLKVGHIITVVLNVSGPTRSLCRCQKSESVYDRLQKGNIRPLILMTVDSRMVKYPESL